MMLLYLIHQLSSLWRRVMLPQWWMGGCMPSCIDGWITFAFSHWDLKPPVFSFHQCLSFVVTEFGNKRALVSAVFFQGWRTNHGRGWWQRPYPHPEVPQPAPQEIAMEAGGTTNYFLSPLNHPVFNPFLPSFRRMIVMLTSFNCFAICVTHRLNLARPRIHPPNFHQWLTFVKMALLMPLHPWLTSWVFAFCEI